jgi:hypothetical protein
VRRSLPALLATLLLMTAAARAQESPGQLVLPMPPQELPEPAAQPDLWHRPRFQVAVGMGASLDPSSGNPHPDRPISSFFFAAGLGAGKFGFDLRSFANGAAKVQVTRLSVELVGVIRPLVFLQRDDYLFRVARTASLDVGPSFERVSKDVTAAWRAGAMLGTHVDLPIGYADAAKELRVRLGLRRMFGTNTALTGIPVGDSALELYAQLAFVF